MDIKKTVENLEKNNMKVFTAKDKSEAVAIFKSLIKKGSAVSVGGSVTLSELGIIDILRSGDYAFLDRYAKSLSADEVKEIFRKSFFSDYYVTSTNAITENGELYNVDGNGNRVAAMIYGPDSVIVIAGTNKIVKDINEANERIKKIAAPKNTVRLSCDTYCSKTGECLSLKDGNGEFTGGCAGNGRICRDYVIMGPQKNKDRIKIILVDESLGY